MNKEVFQLKEIMKPGHPRWHEFRIMLQGKEGCNFSEDESGKVTYNCNCSEDKPLTTKILNTMSEIDTFSSLKYFEEHGGYCDFDIALNIGY